MTWINCSNVAGSDVVGPISSMSSDLLCLRILLRSLHKDKAKPEGRRWPGLERLNLTLARAIDGDLGPLIDLPRLNHLDLTPRNFESRRNLTVWRRRVGAALH